MQAGTTKTPAPSLAVGRPLEVTNAFAYGFGGAAIASIWISVVLSSAFAPDFVSGSQQEHLPLVGFTAWLWGAIATVIVAVATVEGARSAFRSRGAWIALGLGVSLAWLGVFLLSVLSPVFITGTDPTRIPLGSLGAGLLGVFATWFVCLFVKVSQLPAAVPSGAASSTAPESSRGDPTDTLRELAALRDAGVITAEDFEAKKVELLGRM